MKKNRCYFCFNKDVNLFIFSHVTYDIVLYENFNISTVVPRLPAIT